MAEWLMGRRGALAGGLAAISAGSAAAAPWTSVAQLGRRAPGPQDGAVADDQAGEHRDEVEDAAEHAPFRAAFLAWLREASGRFPVPVAADTAAPSWTELHLQGVHPAIWVSLTGAGGIDAGVEWDGVFWDLLTSPDVAAEPVAGGGWENVLLVPEARVVHPTREAAWRVGFEDLLGWINGELAAATHLALWGNKHGGSWAWLARDGRTVRGRQPLVGRNAPVHLLPVHGTAWAAARAALAGHAGYDDRDGRVIGSAVQRGRHVHVYDGRGRQLAMLTAGDGLQGYMGSTVSIRRGSLIHTYDGRGRHLSMTPAR